MELKKYNDSLAEISTEFADEFRKMMSTYFSSKKSLYHYIRMAEGNYREYLKGDMVRAKKYFYVLRPILVCKWILEKGTPPSMLFTELMEAELPQDFKKEVEALLDLKMKSPEIKRIPRVDKINEYLDKSIEDVKEIVCGLKELLDPDWEKLNEVFLKELQRQR